MSDEWNTVRATLAGGDQTRAQMLQSFETPEALFEKLGAQPQEFDWRKAMAGDDQEELKRLERFADLTTARKSWREAEKRVTEAGRVKLPGENATAEELAEWAQSFGVAESPDKYEIKATPPEGYEVSDNDKALLGRLQTKLHEAISKGARAGDLMNIATQFYYDEAGQSMAATEERAAELALDTKDELTKLWGSKADENIKWAVAGVKQFFPGKSEEEMDDFLGLQLSTGHRLGDHPMFLRMMAQVGLQHAEDPFFMQMKGDNRGFDPEKRKAEIMALRETNTKLYNSPEIQAELDKINAGLARRAETRAA